MEKSKYRVFINFALSATYVTTTRNCEDMVTILKGKFFRDNLDGFKIVKITDGVESIIFALHKEKRIARKVIDTETGEIYLSTTDLAKKIGRSSAIVRQMVLGYKKKVKRYRYLLDTELNQKTA